MYEQESGKELETPIEQDISLKMDTGAQSNFAAREEPSDEARDNYKMEKSIRNARKKQRMREMGDNYIQTHLHLHAVLMYNNYGMHKNK